MKINIGLVNDFKKSVSKLLAVTKYWNTEETKEIISFLEKEKILLGIGENRVKLLREKNLDREKTHFIGNIQTKEIKYIVKHSSTIHSLCNLNHIEKIDEFCEEQSKKINAFLQINIDSSKDSGINRIEISKFIEIINNSKNIDLIGISAIGKAEFTRAEKIEEFELLKDLRDKYLPKGLISAGTSRDYKIAIEMGIDIIRVGKSLVG